MPCQLLRATSEQEDGNYLHLLFLHLPEQQSVPFLHFLFFFKHLAHLKGLFLFVLTQASFLPWLQHGKAFLLHKSLTLPQGLQVICVNFLPVQIRPLQHVLELVHTAPFTTHTTAVGALLVGIDDINGSHVDGIIVWAFDPMDGISDIVGMLVDSNAIFGALEGIHDGLADGMEDGLNDGLDDGIEDGLEDGLDDGLDDDMKDGFDKSLEDGLEDGMEDGLEDGMEDGVADKMEDGEADGMEDGESDGLEDGEADGLIDGLKDGLIDGLKDGMIDGMIDGICTDAFTSVHARSRVKRVAANFMVSHLR